MIPLAFAAGMALGGVMMWAAVHQLDREFRDEVDAGLTEISKIVSEPSRPVCCVCGRACERCTAPL